METIGLGALVEITSPPWRTLASWIWDGFGMDVGWIWTGLGMGLEWVWNGFGMDLE